VVFLEKYYYSNVQFMTSLITRACTGPGKSWNFILAFSRTGKGPGK